MENPPSLPDLTPEAIAEAIKGWPRNASRYIHARLADPDRPKKAIIDELGLSDAFPWHWYRDGDYAPAVPGLREIDAAITAGTPFLRREMALEYMERHAPTVAERTVERALWKDGDLDPETGKATKLTDKRLQVSHQAGITVLEVAGLLKRKDGLTPTGEAIQVSIIIEAPRPVTIQAKVVDGEFRTPPATPTT